MLVIYCSITNCTKTPWLKVTNIYYYMVSVGQESGNRLAGGLWLKVSNKAAIKLSARAAIISRLYWGWVHFQNHSCGYWWASGLLWLLVR